MINISEIDDKSATQSTNNDSTSGKVDESLSYSVTITPLINPLDILSEKEFYRDVSEFEDNFFDETKFFIKFNFGYLYFNHLDDFNDNSGWIITQFEMECMDKEMYPHFYNHLCLLMEDDVIRLACVREKSGRTHE